MYLPDYVTFKLCKDRAEEMAEEAMRRSKYSHLRSPILRRRFARFIGFKFVRIGKRLLVYSDNGQRNAVNTVVGHTH